MLLNYIAIGLGGAIGSIARSWLSKVLMVSLFEIPLQIVIVNVLGCFIMGLLTELMALYWSVDSYVKSFLITGFLGGFTTFSTFSLDFGLLVQKNLYPQAVLYAGMSVFFGLACFFLGVKIVYFLHS